MKLADLLTRPRFSQCKVVAGQSGLQTDVVTVGMLDAPDAIEYLKPGSLLLTTGYVLRDNWGQFASLVENMAARGCAGLGIKTNRFISYIPEQVIHTANRHNLPILELPFEYALNELVYTAIESILEKKTEDLSFALDLYDQFTDILLVGAGLEPIVKSLSQITQRNVWVFYPHIDLVATSNHSTAHNVQPDSIMQTALMKLSLQSSMEVGKLTCFSIYEPSSTTGTTISVYPVRVLQRVGLIILDGFLLDAPAWTMTTLRQAGNVIAFELVRLDAIKERELRFNNEFFNDLLDGHVTTDTEIAHRGRQFGIGTDGKYRVVVGKWDRPIPTDVSHEDYRDQVLPLVQLLIRSEQLKPIIFFKNELLVILYSDTASTSDSKSKLVSILTQVIQNVQNVWGLSIAFGISNPVDNLTDLPSGYAQAIEILRVGRLTHPTERIHTFRAQTSMDLLKLVPAKDLQGFRDDVLKAFRELPERAILLQTLYFYLRNHCSVSDTASQLYVHRNTVNYRIDKCRRLMGYDIKDPDDTLKLQLAILVDSMLM